MTINKATNTETIPMCDASLIHEIKLAVEIEQLPTQFTTEELKEWMKRENIKKLDGTNYPELTLELLSNYSAHIPITKKRKQKVLYSSPNGKVFSFNPF
jgi:hypothetical protein